jgi:hypothetical protein
MIPWGGNTHPVSKVRLTANLAALHREINAKFPVLAEQLLYLQEICNRGEFARTVEKAGIDPKTARDLVSFALKQRRLRLDPARLAAVGWPKVRIVLDQLTDGEADNWLTIAAQHHKDALQNRVFAANEKSAPRVATLFRLTAEQLKVVRQAFLLEGVRRDGRGLRNKEAALVALAQRRIAEAQRKASASRPPKKAKAQTQLDMH